MHWLEKLLCWFGWHEIDELFDEDAPYRHRCVRCDWRHPLDGKI